MAQYDGSIRINTAIDQKGFDRGAKSLTQGMTRLGNSLSGIVKSIGLGLSLVGLVKLGKQAIETASDIQEVQNVVDTAFGSMSYKMENFAKTSVKQFGISQLSAKQTGSTFASMGRSMVGSMEQATDMAIALTGRAADMASFYNKSMEETSTALKAVYTGETEVLKSYGVVMTQTNLQEYAATKGITKKVSAMTQAEQVQLRYNYVMEQTSLAAGDFEKTSDSWANQTRILSEQFKELLSILGSGLITVLTPVIKFLNNVLTMLIAIAKQIGEILSKVFGISTATVQTGQLAQDMADAAIGADDLADGIEAAGDAANKAVAPFDKLNVLSKESGESADGGAGKGFEIPALEMEESTSEVDAMSNAIDGLLEQLDSLFGWFTKLKDLFAEGFFDGLGEDWEVQVADIEESARGIIKTLTGIFTGPDVAASAKAMVEKIVYALGQVVGSVISVGTTIAQNIFGGFDAYLEENKDFLKQKLISIFDIAGDIYLLVGEAFDSIAFVFEAFASEQGQQLTANIIGIFENGFMGVLELAWKFAEDIISTIITPFTDNKEGFREALEGFLGVLSEVTGTIKDGIDETFAKLNEVYDEHLKPFFDSVTEGLSDLVGEFLDFWNEDVQPVLDKFAEKFNTLWKEHIQPVFNKFSGVIGKVGDMLKALWENVIQPLISWVIRNVLPVVLPILEGIGNAFLTAKETISDVIGDILDAIGGIVDFLTGVFEGDWEKAWNGIVDAFKGIFNIIPDVIEGIINKAIDIINGIIGGVNAIVDKVPVLGKKIPDIPEIEHVTIPRLADGAVIRGGDPFMAVLGDQRHGQTNIETPLPTMVKAFKQALAESGGAGGGEYTFIAQIDGKTIFEETVKQDRMYRKAKGRSAYAY